MVTTVTYPSGTNFPGFTTYDLILGRKSVGLRSPFTGKRQTLAMPYAVWILQATYSKADLVNAGKLRSFLAQLDGQANNFRLKLPDYHSPSTGYAGPAGAVNGANQVGTSLITNGWSNSVALFKEGDYFNINDELKLITADVSSNGSGQATLNFKPAIRTSPANALALGVVDPTVLLVSTDDNAASWKLTPPILYDFVLNAMEDI
jgi:hypothetical protein